MENQLQVIFDIIERISNINFQKEVWIQGRYWDAVSSFGESINLLDDYGFFDKFSYFENLLNKDESEKIKHFKNLLLLYDPKDNMLEDKEWISITRLARELLPVIEQLQLNNKSNP